jgi:hypothetical protein
MLRFLEKASVSCNTVGRGRSASLIT